MQILENKWVVLVILALTWGSSFILIKYALTTLSPYQIGALRVGIAGLVLLPIGLPSLMKMPKKAIFWVSLSGFLGNFLPMFLFPIAQTNVSSAIAGILNSTVPIFVLVFGYLLFKNATRRMQWVGAIVGFIGVYVLISASNSKSESTSIVYALIIVLACVFYALSALIVKEKLTHIPSLKLSASVFTIWLIPCLLILIFTNFFTEFNTSPDYLTGIGYVLILALIGTALAMILFYKLIQKTTTVFASSVTYLMPIVAVFWGVIFGEEMHVEYIAGGLIILLGVYLIREVKEKS